MGWGAQDVMAMIAAALGSLILAIGALLWVSWRTARQRARVQADAEAMQDAAQRYKGRTIH